MDQYIERIKPKGAIDSMGVASWELDLPSVVEKFGFEIDSTFGDAKVNGELKKLNKQLRQIIDLKKKANLMNGVFYICVIALGFVYLLIISRWTL
jgi:hypothetical protein